MGKGECMILVIRTQIHENYAWVDGEIQTGANAYWKAKGGREYKIASIPSGIDYAEVVELANVERADDYFLESVIDWSIESDDYLSWFEKSQLDYEGSIAHPEPKLDYAELVNA
jgi:hypothetical protein